MKLQNVQTANNFIVNINDYIRTVIVWQYILLTSWHGPFGGILCVFTEVHRSINADIGKGLSSEWMLKLTPTLGHKHPSVLNDPVTFRFPWNGLKWPGSDIRGEFTCAGPLGRGAPCRTGTGSPVRSISGGVEVWGTKTEGQNGARKLHAVSQPVQVGSLLLQGHSFTSQSNSGVAGLGVKQFLK